MSEVIHQPITPVLKNMPDQERLWLQWRLLFSHENPRPLKLAGAVFTVNGQTMKSEIRFSLKTSNHKEAARKAAE